MPPSKEGAGDEPEETAAFIAGSVRDAKTGDPVPAFGIRLQRGTNGSYREFRDSTGRFHFPVEEAGACCIMVYASTHETAGWINLDLPPSGGLSDIVVELVPGCALSGRVVDAASGAPVPGTVVMHHGEGCLIDIFTGSPSLARHAITDGEGRFTLGALAEWEMTVVAAHPEYASALCRATPGDAGFVIALGRGARVSGCVRDDAGRSCAGILVRAEEAFPCHDEEGEWSGTRFVLRPVFSDTAGRYRIPPLNAGEIRLVASVHGEAVTGPVAFTREERKVLLVDRDVEVDFGPSPLFTTWRGTVRDRTGMPPAAALLYVRPFDRYEDVLPHGAPCPRERRIHTGEDGRFELRKLLPGRHQVEVFFGPEFRHRQRIDHVDLVTTGIVDRDIVIEGEWRNSR